ncbi:cupin domain-containing protein [Calothrix sp. NIES-3974]|uniref:cupin domain-containing protein n=1 Tax=Calothrix sp. NIES-3974 TaxID=2005462 RepID=UPI000B5EEA43|nr:cupin domain-containing protein [Calothrix sp. NIES-3974]BAZ05712.1 hypothetical protein NIES3974_23660 [Calothrix sp. NIES-3974]
MIIDPQEVPQESGSRYPQEFQTKVAGRIRQRLGDFAQLQNFGVNLVTLLPGSASALRHYHSQQDEFIYILAGELTLITNGGERILTPGMAAGFPKGEANGHHLVNKSTNMAMYLEIGDRSANDTVNYPDDDLIAQPQKNGKGYIFLHKDGSSY